MARVKTKTGKLISVSSGTKGAISEHYATAWLLSKGYDVFRNVSPNGRADLLAVDWKADEIIRVDVKSEGFSLQGDSSMHSANREMNRMNDGFNIRYLIAKNDGDCEWFEDVPKADNDNEPPPPMWWTDKKTGQRFLTPGNAMTSKGWCFFCHWLLRAYPDFIVPFSEQFVRSISARGLCTSSPMVNAKEVAVLEKLHKHFFRRIAEAEIAQNQSGEAA